MSHGFLGTWTLKVYDKLPHNSQPNPQNIAPTIKPTLRWIHSRIETFAQAREAIESINDLVDVDQKITRIEPNLKTSTETQLCSIHILNEELTKDPWLINSER